MTTDGVDRSVMMEGPDVAGVDDDSNTNELERFCYPTQHIGSVPPRLDTWTTRAAR